MPWLGVTVVGTTDLEHEQPLTEEPRISKAEGDYLLEGVRRYFPDCSLRIEDVISTFAGIRPVLHTGKKDPSKEAEWAVRHEGVVLG